jgi:hypothetical protein
MVVLCIVCLFCISIIHTASCQQLPRLICIRDGYVLLTSVHVTANCPHASQDLCLLKSFHHDAPTAVNVLLQIAFAAIKTTCILQMHIASGESVASHSGCTISTAFCSPSERSVGGACSSLASSLLLVLLLSGLLCWL